MKLFNLRALQLLRVTPLLLLCSLTCNHTSTVSLIRHRSVDSLIVSAEVSVHFQLRYPLRSTFVLAHDFDTDIYVIDEQLTTTLRTYTMTLFSVFSTLFVISSVTPM